MPCGMTLVKQFPYKNLTAEEYSNRYWFTGTTPADSAAWLALFNALSAQEKTLYPNTTKIVRAYGYASDAPDAVSVWQRDLTIAPNSPVLGTLPLAGEKMPGDAAFWIRWKTSRLNERGRAIYLRKYYHDVFGATGGRDTFHSNYTTAGDAFGNKLRDGTFLDGRTLTAAGHTDVLVGHGLAPYIGRRQLRKGPKRPPTP